MNEKPRVRWLCRRGMKELDILLERFVEHEYDALDAHERAELTRLLEQEDPDLYAQLMARRPPVNDAQARLLARIRRFSPAR